MARGAGGGQRVQDRAAGLRCLLPEEPRGRGDALVEESEDDLVLHARFLITLAHLEPAAGDQGDAPLP